MLAVSNKCGSGEISRRARFGIWWDAPSEGQHPIRVRTPSAAPIFMSHPIIHELSSPKEQSCEIDLIFAGFLRKY